MKAWQKIVAFLSVATMITAVAAGCGATDTGADTDENTTPETSAAESTADEITDTSDWDYIAEKGNMIVGITYFEPMNYMDANNELTGFETEFTKAVCEKLGINAEFQKIEWESKEVELETKAIDCIWNGMTITDERLENMQISVPYMENKQIMVVKQENVEKYATAEGVKGATVVAEKGSAGEEVAQGDEFFADAKYTGVESQARALQEVLSGTADVAIIDYVMTIGALGEGTDFASLNVIEGIDFAPEEYGIAFRKGSLATVQKVNNAIQELANEGKLAEIAEKYNLQDLLLVKPAE